MFKIQGSVAQATVTTDIIENSCISQIYQVCSHPAAKGNKIVIMPDTHTGFDIPIGTTMSITNGLIVPDWVSGDIACGVLTVNLGKVNIDFERFDKAVHAVPAGQNLHEKAINPGFSKHVLSDGFLTYNDLRHTEIFDNSLGTLGGGNHFIELDKADDGNVYLLIHTGSRGVGQSYLTSYKRMARKAYEYKANHIGPEDKRTLLDSINTKSLDREMQKAIAELRAAKRASLPKIPNELYYLEGADAEHYIKDMLCVYRWAAENRKTIAKIILSEYIGCKFDDINLLDIDISMPKPHFKAFDTVHNYIEFQDNNMILRKGAVSAKRFEIFVIPINMNAGTLLCRGKGNPDWNFSAPHGAGRALSRKEAKELISLEDYKKSMEGIYSTCIHEGTIDESCFAYKSMQDIINFLSPTAEIIDIMHPIYNFKA